MISRTEAFKAKSNHAYRARRGYVKLGPLAMPAKPVAPERACEPPLGAAEGSWHMLQPPKGAALMRMQWSVGPKEWAPSRLGAGRRLAFTSAYLAAHGWKYSRPTTSKDSVK
jgi:hypothetical protein